MIIKKNILFQISIRKYFLTAERERSLNKDCLSIVMSKYCGVSTRRYQLPIIKPTNYLARLMPINQYGTIVLLLICKWDPPCLLMAIMERLCRWYSHYARAEKWFIENPSSRSFFILLINYFKHKYYLCNFIQELHSLAGILTGNAHFLKSQKWNQVYYLITWMELKDINYSVVIFTGIFTAL